MGSTGDKNSITDIPGVKVGHFTDQFNLTGVTVVQAPEGTSGGVDVRGGSPGTRETDLLSPVNRIQRVDAITLCGSSAFGLNSIGGVMRYLEENGIGHPVRNGLVVPIVPGAVIYDLGRGEGDKHIDETSGYEACVNASARKVVMGNVGAGTGAVSGGYKGGVGSASEKLENGVVVGAIVVVNSSGLAFDNSTGGFYARGLERDYEFKELRDDLLARYVPRPRARWRQAGHTTIGVVATNVGMNKSQATKIAQMAHDGLARAIYPAHTMFDGDTIFSLSTGEVSTSEYDKNAEDRILTQVGLSASDCFARAVIHAVCNAETVDEYPCHRSSFPKAYV